MILRKREETGIERESTRSHSVENWLWNGYEIFVRENMD
jgi:hypothetical protein